MKGEEVEQKSRLRRSRTINRKKVIVFYKQLGSRSDNRRLIENYVPTAFSLSENRKQCQQMKEKKGASGLRREENIRYILLRKKEGKQIGDILLRK